MSKSPLYIVKVGGNVINQDEKLSTFLDAFTKLSGHKILVHGGGREATVLAEKMDVEVEMIEGRRITSDEMIDIVTMVYGGLINKRIVSKLQAHNCNAIGLSGVDGNLILSDKRPLKNGIDYGWVGDPKAVDSTLLEDLLQRGNTPVVAPLTHDGKGNMLNTNADTIASVLATGLSAQYDVHLAYAFELNGVMRDVNDPSSVVSNITQTSYQQLKDEGAIVDGMIPKLDNAFEAIDKGVKTVCILNYEKIGELNSQNHGHTVIS